MVPPDTFESGNVRLRRPAAADATCMFECGNDAEVARHADWPVGTTLERVSNRIRTAPERWDSGEEYRWVITADGDDSALGAISCFVEGHKAEIGYFIHRGHWGKGLATAAARAVVEWAISEPGIQRVWATCDHENIASIRVLEKVGMEKEGTLRKSSIRPNISQEPRDSVIYSRVR